MRGIMSRERSGKAMILRGETLRNALRGAAERTPYISDYRKTTDGRIVRFVDWRKAAKRRSAR
jgi:hypothetical protein